ncbi:YeiH family protein [Limosilactobacillus equigenerosi]|uniref:Putative membrane protein n=1 Tax=Limosilactobacillus equigenerosi DSM 18793 = JCM 14505 TaxID=1423742 RepID=A0A0R1UP06_9LACO|nr:YeiH family protein [Limosilactobacillus equigenerosi]KRL94992.1 putative membrane protein [Limosilactobacillus equigenerosi DSM 18793 = JCM 14505]
MEHERLSGIGLCLLLAIPAWWVGNLWPVIGGPVLGIILGMIITQLWPDKGIFQDGINWTGKKVLQVAVVLLGFGLDLGVIWQTGVTSLPIIVVTITVALVIAYVLHRTLGLTGNAATLIGVGSSICGGSAIAATAPVVDADDDEIAQAMSVIFFFNVIAAILFPWLGHWLGFSTTTGHAFGIFAGTAINDTSSVTAAAATWDSMWHLGSQTLSTAVTVKLTRTLAIIPITFGLALYQVRQHRGSGDNHFSLKRAFPMFILYFILAALITTISVHGFGANPDTFNIFKQLAKFMIVMAMVAIGMNTDVVKLIRTGGKPLLLGASCWFGITVASLLMQHFLNIW